MALSKKRVSFRAAVILTMAAAAPVAVFAACSSNGSGASPFNNGDDASLDGSSGSSGGSGSSGASGSSGGDMDATLVTYDGPPPNVDGGMLGCTTPSGLPIKFNPVYSGYDGVHTYQVPVFVVGIDPATVTWGSSDPSMVAFQPYVRGVMITTKKAGDVTIIARTATQCGSASLHIESYTTAEWDLGNARYNNNNPLNFDSDAAGISINIANGLPDGGYDGSIEAACADPQYQNLMNPFETPPAACTNCHGANSTGTVHGVTLLAGQTLFSDVQHTPEQTGGFSEDDLNNAVINGTIPDGGYFDNSIIPYCFWHKFHTWRDITDPETQKGVRAYLRSLVPQEQLGCFELFNANMCADGG